MQLLTQKATESQYLVVLLFCLCYRDGQYDVIPVSMPINIDKVPIPITIATCIDSFILLGIDTVSILYHIAHLYCVTTFQIIISH